jgi:hypothetical protein
MRDATEKKLLSVIIAQEQYIQEVRDKSMQSNVDGMIGQLTMSPMAGGGVFSHGMSRLYQIKKAAPVGTKVDPIIDAFLEQDFQNKENVKQ